MSVGALLYLSIFYLSGLHFGYIRSTVPFSLSSLGKNILPCLIIIIASEIVRHVLVVQKKPLATALSFAIGILSQIALTINLQAITHFNAFMDLTALTLFPAFSAGILYTHVSVRYGAIPNILYRACITLSAYFIPLTPNLPDIFIAFSNLLFPLLLFCFLRSLFEPKKKRATEKPQKRIIAYLSAFIGILLATALLMLISCQFRFGAVVIATESMTGELNVGDAIIYERYEEQIISEGQIIVFQKEKTLLVHRVVEIENINGQTRYYTKGDANSYRDDGFVTDSDIVGVTDIKVAHVGYPTLWIRRIFANN